MHPSIVLKGSCLQQRAISASVFGCPLCPRFSTRSQGAIQRHLDTHLACGISFDGKVICKCHLPCRDKGHFHCLFCETMMIHKRTIENHLKQCLEKMDLTLRAAALPISASPCQHPSSESHHAAVSTATAVDYSYSSLRSSVLSVECDHSYSQAASPTPPAADPEPEKPIQSTSVDPIVLPSHVKCPHCPLVLYKKNMFVHVARKHKNIEEVPAKSHFKSTSVDNRNGLFAVCNTSKGFRVPVHVQRKTWGQQEVRCEMKDCRQYKLLAQRSGLSHSSCQHIRSVEYCTSTVRAETLGHGVLQEMMDIHFFTDSKAAVCRKRQQEAEEAQVPFSVLVDITGSKNYLCLSIYEPRLHHYSNLGRVFVTYSIEKNTWHCPCTKARSSCPHKDIARWHLFQTHRMLFHTLPPPSPAVMAAHSVSYLTVDIESTVRYVYGSKKIPNSLPDEVTARRALEDFPRHLFPIETLCVHCSGEQELEEPVQITNKAIIVGMEGLVTNVSTYDRRCNKCLVVYRYQEWTDGLHNFNNHIIMTLQLCLYLRHNLQNHVSVSRVIGSLENLLKIKFPATDLILQGYCQFEALCNTEYQYSCVSCGFYPPVVVMDLYREGAFTFEVNELDQPGEAFSGKHDIAAFWESVDLHMVSRGFYEYPTQNPFVIHPAYEKWAPWIGGRTRKDNMVLNTEYAKVPLKTSSGDMQLGDVTEDRGWSIIMCPHGIVYSVKFNLRAESPRDFADLLLSWKHLPNICIYDFARELVAHTNPRVPDNPPFQPFDGRLAEPTKEIIEDAGCGRLKVHLPWLLDKLEIPESDGHPVTGSADRHVLYDKFHQANTKDPVDVLRCIQLVPELQETLNSQSAEQLFAALRNNNYFLNNMGPSAHIFLMRNIIEHRNGKQNEKLVEHLLRRGLQNS